MAMVGVGPNFNDVGVHGSPSCDSLTVRVSNCRPSRVELSLGKATIFPCFLCVLCLICVFYIPKITQFWNSGGLNSLEHVCV